MAREYFDNIEDFRAAAERIYNYCVIRDQPVRVTAHRAVETQLGGIMYGHRQNMSPYEDLHQIRTAFPVEWKELAELSDNLQRRLLENGFLIDSEDQPFITHSFKFMNGRFESFFYGIMSDEEAVVQGFRHGALEITRIPQRKGMRLGPIN